MYELAFAKSFKKSIKRLLKSKDSKVVKERLEMIIEIISQRKTLGSKYRDHALQGAFGGYRECHIKPDVLLLYEIDERRLLVTLVNIGSHSGLFG
ncbi:MAG TPA: type II toxin-antitoxin system YafQ family toxin [Candidatus Yonathbacteria bacterium]|nr:type II toxin-antitoxin system YafQ family toxin [Candidatus Yonathbacteria bacterium]